MRQTAAQIPKDNVTQDTYGNVIREMGGSLKDMAKSEVELVIAESKKAVHDIKKHATQAAIFGAMLAVSVLPLLAFFVIALGKLMNDSYALSSLVVAIVFGVLGGFFAYSAYKKLTTKDLKFSYTKNSVNKIKKSTQKKAQEVKEAIT